MKPWRVKEKDVLQNKPGRVCDVHERRSVFAAGKVAYPRDAPPLVPLAIQRARACRGDG